MNFFLWIGLKTFNFFKFIYFFSRLGVQAFSSLRRINFYKRQVLEQFYAVTTGSLPVIFIAATFTGMVIGAQAVSQMKNTIVPQSLVGAAFLKAVLVELGPVLTALILAGRIGAGISAELGTMKVSEQIDALESLALDPKGFLVMPRLIAGFLIMPALNILACILSIISGFVTVNITMGLSFSVFKQGMEMVFVYSDVWLSSFKAFCFGGYITWIACYFGLNCDAGAKGVGRATTSSVVMALVGILVLDYIILKIFPIIRNIIG